MYYRDTRMDNMLDFAVSLQFVFTVPHMKTDNRQQSKQIPQTWLDIKLFPEFAHTHTHRCTLSTFSFRKKHLVTSRLPLTLSTLLTIQTQAQRRNTGSNGEWKLTSCLWSTSSPPWSQPHLLLPRPWAPTGSPLKQWPRNMSLSDPMVQDQGPVQVRTFKL